MKLKRNNKYQVLSQSPTCSESQTNVCCFSFLLDYHQHPTITTDSTILLKKILFKGKLILLSSSSGIMDFAVKIELFKLL